MISFHQKLPPPLHNRVPESKPSASPEDRLSAIIQSYGPRKGPPPNQGGLEEGHSEQIREDQNMLVCFFSPGFAAVAPHYHASARLSGVFYDKLIWSVGLCMIMRPPPPEEDEEAVAAEATAVGRRLGPTPRLSLRVPCVSNKIRPTHSPPAICSFYFGGGKCASSSHITALVFDNLGLKYVCISWWMSICIIICYTYTLFLHNCFRICSNRRLRRPWWVRVASVAIDRVQAPCTGPHPRIGGFLLVPGKNDFLQKYVVAQLPNWGKIRFTNTMRWKILVKFL